MKTYAFPYSVRFGKNDIVESVIDCSLNNKQAVRLERSAHEGNRFKLKEEESLKDVYDRVLSKIVLKEKELLKMDPTLVFDSLSWNRNHSGTFINLDDQVEHYIDNLSIGINYPVELQMLPPRATRRVQKHYKAINLEQEQVREFLADKKNKNYIVYVDQGKTLVSIPKSYSGLFIVESSVTKIEEDAFKKCKKITTVIIENGLPEISRGIFEGCEALEEVTIPSSVKSIGFNAFSKCSNLRALHMLNGLEEIENTAFRFCFNLKELRLPATVHSISMFINGYNNGLRDIYFEGNSTLIDNSRGGDWSRITMHVKAGSKAEAFAKDQNIKYVLF